MCDSRIVSQIHAQRINIGTVYRIPDQVCNRKISFFQWKFCVYVCVLCEVNTCSHAEGRGKCHMFCSVVVMSYSIATVSCIAGLLPDELFLYPIKFPFRKVINWVTEWPSTLHPPASASTAGIVKCIPEYLPTKRKLTNLPSYPCLLYLPHVGKTHSPLHFSLFFHANINICSSFMYYTHWVYTVL